MYSGSKHKQRMTVKDGNEKKNVRKLGSHSGQSQGPVDPPDLKSTQKTPVTSESTTDSGINLEMNMCDICGSDSGFHSGLGDKPCDCNKYDSGRLDSGMSSSSGMDSSIKLDSGMESSTKLDSGILDTGSSIYSTDSGIDLQVHEKFSELSIDLSTTPEEKTAERITSNVQTKDASEESGRLDSGVECDWTRNVRPVNISNIKPVPKQLISLIEKSFSQDDDGDTHLHLAIIHELFEAVYTLIKLAPHPVFLDILNNMCQTPLHLAVLTHQPRIVRLLVMSGARQTTRDRKGNTALHLACASGDMDCIRELLKPYQFQPADMMATKLNIPDIAPMLTIRNYDGLLCTHLATLGGYIDVLKELHKHGAEFNIQEGKCGHTPLHLAVESRNCKIINVLVKSCGADLAAESYCGMTPVQLAYYTSTEVFNQLMQLGAYHLLPSSDSEDSDSDDYMDEDSVDKSIYKVVQGGEQTVC